METNIFVILLVITVTMVVCIQCECPNQNFLNKHVVRTEPEPDEKKRYKIWLPIAKKKAKAANAARVRKYPYEDVFFVTSNDGKWGVRYEDGHDGRCYMQQPCATRYRCHYESSPRDNGWKCPQGLIRQPVCPSHLTSNGHYTPGKQFFTTIK